MPEDNQDSGQQQQQQQQQQQDPGQGETPPTWETILQGLPEDQQSLYQAHTQGLRGALDKERTQRSDLEKQVREAAGKAKGEVQAELAKLADQLTEANRQADFYKEAGNPEIGCTSPELALLAAEKDGLFDRRGVVNWQALREAYPVLFQQQTTPATRGNAGSGTTAPLTTGPDIDALIRAKAGIRR